MSETLSPLVLSAKAFLDRIKFSRIMRQLGHKPTAFLDVGCGDGRYLHQFADAGISKGRIYGIELMSPSIGKLRAAGFQVFAQRVEECDAIPTDSIDLITMFHVIEHVENPVNVLKRLASWLSPNGILALETPNTESIDRRMFCRWWGGYHIPRHWTLFNQKSMTRFLHESGLQLLDIRFQTGHSFWMYSLHHLLKYNRVMPLPRLAGFFDPMRSRVALSMFTAIDLVRSMFGAKTSAMLVLAKKAN